MKTATNSTILSLKTNKDVKALAQLRAKQLGIPLGTIVNAFLRNFAQTGEAHFVAPEPMTPQMAKIIKSIEAEIARGDTYGPFNPDEAINFLNNNSPRSLKLNDDAS